MTFTSVNPHDPADVIGEWDAAGEREVAAVVERARRGADTWRRTPAAARAAALTAAAAAVEQRAAEVTALTVREVGKPVTEARAEVARAVSILRYNAQLALLPDGETLPAAVPDALLMARRRRPSTLGHDGRSAIHQDAHTPMITKRPSSRHADTPRHLTN